MQSQTNQNKAGLGWISQSLNPDSDLFRTVVDSMGDGVVVASSEGKLIYFNEVARALVGYGETESSKQDWTNYYGIFYEDALTPVPSDSLTIVRCLRGEEVDNDIVFIRNPLRPEGRYLRVTGRPIRDLRSEVLGAVLVFHDITQEREMTQALSQSRERLREAKDLAEEANLTKDKFLRNMSHELRTPLAAIMGYADALLSNENLGKDELEKLCTIGRNAQHLLELVEDILDFSKIKASGVHLQKSVFNPRSRLTW